MAIEKLGRTAIAVLILVTSSVAMAAAPKKQNPGVSGGALQAPRAPQAVLYDQTDNAAGNGAPDQDFEASYDTYDSEGADDFVVPAGGWVIQSIDTVGITDLAGGSTVDVTFYTNGAGLPGTAIAACTYAAITPVDTAGSLGVTLPTDCNLAAGTYWMAIQVNQNYGTNGQHFWSNRTVASGSNAVWRNPGDGFATGCTAFTSMLTCGVGGGTSPDFLFRLNGVIPPAATDLSITKTAGAAAVDVGSQVTYTLAVQHVSGGAATNVVVTDTLPAGLTYVSNSCGATFAGGTLTWNVGGVAVAGSASCQLVATVTAPGSISNTATVTATETDPDATNSTSTAAITAIGESVVPTLNGLGLAALGLALAAAGLFALRRTV
jgi:uncharacterized repeat protein (TIGR01451 family)